ncbi:exodeoxyribonuclease V subunit gamma [Pseudoalteromonas sp. T1lg48]|uniref:exodeoxyribonuclease V subunit gamma n=1 Tax=Pseudoalteromonas sp. T1lg48 TaxID=2077100 RepID=UPI000CF5F3E1|nr:exodeoxyribonuclease V subunit gamma [Pseudoalteromonas sp. T1lg48]
MLHIIQSNRMEILSAQLCALLATPSSEDIFARELVLVHSPGMSQWLKLELTKQLGVCAQVDFPLPSSFVWSLYQQVLPGVPEESAFNKANMAWKLYELLEQKLPLPNYEALASYLEDDIDGSKRHALCEKIADVFDHYLMYRPQWLQIWEQGEDELDEVDIAHAPWQPDLWRSLVAAVAERGQSPYHRANMHEALLAALDGAKVQLPPRICLFGISALAQSQLEVFNALAQHTQVLIFLFNPSEHYWGDLVDEKTLAKINSRYQVKPQLDAAAEGAHYYIVGNPLLASWGKLGRDYLEQLIQLDGKWIDGFDDEFAPHLLGQLQKEVYELAFKGQSLAEDTQWFVSDEGKMPLRDDDTSVQLANCHTQLREVECLHDHLLREFAKDPSLTPKDIIVMMPDVGQYSPFIEAVFGGAKGARHIPYAIADLSIAQERPLLNAILVLANLPFSRFGVSELMDLLQIGAISQRFSLSEQELQQCHVWLEQVGVKWGIDGEHKSEFALPTLALNTWQLGLQRLLLGMATKSQPYRGLYPADAVEGMNSDILSKLLCFINALLEAKALLSPDVDLAQKVAAMRQVLEHIFADDSLSAVDLATIDTLFTSIDKHYFNGDYLGPISQRVFVNLLQQGIDDKGVGQRFLMGQVNFCTLMPMRAVPFKKVCILGLNDADYPRNVQPIGFDLVPFSKRRKGDRSRRLDDRYLFLEALLSARDSVYLSYIGRSSRDNSERMPSILLSELCEYIDRCFYYPDKAMPVSAVLTAVHHLQPFHSDYYQSEGSWQSFNPIWALTYEDGQEQGEQPALEAHPEAIIELDALLHCATRAQQFFYQQVLAVRIADIDEGSDDNEHFTLEALARYQLLDELLECAVNDKEVDDAELIQRGVLPQGIMAEVTLGQLKTRITALAQQVRMRLGEQSPLLVEVDVNVGGHQIQGWLSHIYANEQVFYRSASIKPKDRIKGFIYHLLAQLSGHAVSTVVMGLDEQVRFAPLTADHAEQLLLPWLALYREAHTRSPAFFPISAWEWLQQGEISKANTKFVGAYIGVPERADPYISADYRDLYQCEQEFCDWAQQLLAPINELAEEEKYADS